MSTTYYFWFYFYLLASFLRGIISTIPRIYPPLSPLHPSFSPVFHATPHWDNTTTKAVVANFRNAQWRRHRYKSEANHTNTEQESRQRIADFQRPLPLKMKVHPSKAAFGAKRSNTGFAWVVWVISFVICDDEIWKKNWGDVPTWASDAAESTFATARPAAAWSRRAKISLFFTESLGPS